MQRTDGLDVERGGFLQQRLHLCAVLSADVEVVAACLASPVLVGGERAELAECVGREQHLVLCVVCHDDFWPVHHRRAEELECVRSERQFVAFLHHLCA